MLQNPGKSAAGTQCHVLNCYAVFLGRPSKQKCRRPVTRLNPAQCVENSPMNETWATFHLNWHTVVGDGDKTRTEYLVQIDDQLLSKCAFG
jgi:hypothetical protein